MKKRLIANDKAIRRARRGTSAAWTGTGGITGGSPDWCHDSTAAGITAKQA
jgi:hypothetical protein